MQMILLQRELLRITIVTTRNMASMVISGHKPTRARRHRQLNVDLCARPTSLVTVPSVTITGKVLSDMERRKPSQNTRMAIVTVKFEKRNEKESESESESESIEIG